MALRAAGMVKNQLGATDLVLTARAGEGLLIRDVRIGNPATAYVTLGIDRTTVGYFRVSGSQGNHLYFTGSLYHLPNLLSLLADVGMFSGYPVPEGVSFTITGASQTGAYQSVLYDIYDAADIGRNMVNGPDANVCEYMAYGRAAATLVAGDNLYTVSQNPVEFSGFPFGVVCPAGRKITLFAVALSSFARTSGTAANKQRTRYLRLVKERQVLLDLDKNGLLCDTAEPAADGTAVGTGNTVVGNRADIDMSIPFFFPVPLEFKGNEELNVYVSTVLTLGAVNILVADAEVGFWCKSEPL